MTSEAKPTRLAMRAGLRRSLASFPWYVLLVPLVPVTSMYAEAGGGLRPDEFARSAAAATIVAGGLFGTACAIYRDAQKAALLVSLAIVVFLAFDPLYAMIEDARIAGFRVARRAIAIPATYFLLALCAWRIRAIRRPLGPFTAFANVMAAGSLLLPALMIARSSAGALTTDVPMLELPRVHRDVTDRPNIYYVVFDRYGDERTMLQRGLDNAPFYEDLSGEGFYVARESRSNYLKTILSLASSLNMSYLDPLAAAEGPDSANWQPVYEWVRHSRVVRFLKSEGYRYVHAGSWYGPTATSPAADRHLNTFATVPMAAMRLLDSELMTPVRRVVATPWLDARLQQWHRVRWQVDEVVARAGEPGPTFTFVHILVPHSPFVFDADGSYVTADEEARRTPNQNYVNQVQAANLFVRRLVDGILASAASPPVIILQGDEGPYPVGTGSGAGDYDWRTASAAQLQEKSGILNAFYLPGRTDAQLYPSISPVNSFRVVFNAYLGTRLELLPDRVFGHESERRPYVLFDVTDVVRPPSTPAPGPDTRAAHDVRSSAAGPIGFRPPGACAAAGCSALSISALSSAPTSSANPDR